MKRSACQTPAFPLWSHHRRGLASFEAEIPVIDEAEYPRLPTTAPRCRCPHRSLMAATLSRGPDAEPRIRRPHARLLMPAANRAAGLFNNLEIRHDRPS
jgi:hypothetical protein